MVCLETNDYTPNHHLCRSFAPRKPSHDTTVLPGTFPQKSTKKLPDKHRPTAPPCWWEDETETNHEDESLVIAIHREIESSHCSSSNNEPCFIRLSMSGASSSPSPSAAVRFNELVRVSEFEPIDILYHPLLYYTQNEIERMRNRYLQERDTNSKNVPLEEPNRFPAPIEEPHHEWSRTLE